LKENVVAEILRMGMVGGGPGSFIGPVHRRAAELDGRIRLVAGAFSRNALASSEAGASYGIDPDRAYPDYRTMLAEEAKRTDGIDFVTIVTPNDTHFAIARDAIEAGYHVVSDKPATATLEEALELQRIISSHDRCYALSFTYTGYAMLREARALVADGAIGKVRKVVVEYFQGWLAQAAEKSGNKQAEWRADPTRAGIGGCIGDIGVHAFNLAEFVTGVPVVSIIADLPRVVEGRQLDDDCTILMRLANGAPGLIAASQIATGERNGLRLRVWGDEGGLDWCHERPDRLVFTRGDGRMEVRWAGGSGLSASAAAATRLPAGHPEGFIEALANIYGDFHAAVVGRDLGIDTIQGITEGARSMHFVAAAVEQAESVEWVKMV
jgi:predicted dehydrogenase